MDIVGGTVVAHNNGMIWNETYRASHLKEHLKSMKILKGAREIENEDINTANKIIEEYQEKQSKYSAMLKCKQYVEIPVKVGQDSTKYRATWGHKINHSFSKMNSWYLVISGIKFFSFSFFPIFLISPN